MRQLKQLIDVFSLLMPAGRTARWLISDQLAYALAKAATAIATATSQDRKEVITSLFRTYANLKQGLESADGIYN
jgi:hypothetical protein